MTYPYAGLPELGFSPEFHETGGYCIRIKIVCNLISDWIQFLKNPKSSMFSGFGRGDTWRDAVEPLADEVIEL